MDSSNEEVSSELYKCLRFLRFLRREEFSGPDCSACAAGRSVSCILDRSESRQMLAVAGVYGCISSTLGSEAVSDTQYGFFLSTPVRAK